jgi:hypothetical protein
MIRIYLKFTIYLLAIVFPLFGLGQSATVSPYSYYGIGDLQNQTGAQGFAMGKTGIALRNDSTTPYFINLRNPASYFFNRITTFEAGVLDNQISMTTMGQTHKNNNAYFGYFALAFPVGKYFGACVGLTPMSSVGYNISTTSPLDSITPSGQSVPIDNVSTTYVGSGGINNLFLGLAVSPFKWVSAGVHLSYLFGNMSNATVIEYPANYNAFTSNQFENTQVKSLYLNYGIMFCAGRSTGWNGTLGATVGLGSNINASYNLLQYNTLNGLVYDTIKDSNVNGSLRMPLTWGVGLTIKKGEKWAFTAEYSTQKWSQYSFFGQTENLNNSTHMGFGVQYIPHKNFDAPHTYFQRVQYRLGFSYDQTFLNLNNTAINDYCATAGVALPIGRYYYMSRASVLNLGLQIGQLGTTANNLLKEQYFKLLISFTFDDRWFVKRQFE